MKFACDTCSTKYVIPDERVAGRMLRVRCKRCRSVMEVVGPRQLTDAAPSAAVPTDVATDRPLFSARARDPFMAAGGDGDSMWQVQGENDSAGVSADGMQVTARAKAVLPPKVPLDAQARWYVAIKGQCRGPFTDEEMDLLARRGRIHTRTRAWKGGMTQWMRVADCTELAFLHGTVKDRESRGLPTPPQTPAVGTPVLDEVTGMQMGWTTGAGKPFANLVTSHALLTQPEETPPPVPMLTSTPPLRGVGTGGTDWFVVDADAVARILEETPDTHVPGTSPHVTGVHVVRRWSPAWVLAAVAGALLMLTVVGLLVLPMLMDTGNVTAPVVKDITARTPVATQTEIAPSANAEQVQEIRALGEGRPEATTAPADSAEPTPARTRPRNAQPLKKVEGALEKSATQLFGPSGN